uniref:GTPase-activating protein and VPS9 domain-containing protein 1-like n=1 Tax=Scleropages formosus TaxID=113540 RepID=A0A8C9VDF7_SCLFO
MAQLTVHTLAHHLKQERLYVASEKQLIQRLNTEVLKTAEKLYQAAWIARQQRVNLDQLNLTSADMPPAECCHSAQLLEDTQFIDAHRVLGFQEGAYGKLLRRLQEDPRLLACCLAVGQKLSLECVPISVQTVFTSLYGGCVTQEDEVYLLQVLRYLVEVELQESRDAIRLLHRRSCAFSLVFRLFSEGLYSARLFLTAALHGPVMELLVDDEDHLETDPGKLLERLEPAQRERRGWAKATAEGNAVKLAALVSRFANSLRSSARCFPPGLRWVLAQVHQMLLARVGVQGTGSVGEEEARAVCSRLLFANFLCLAIMNPEQYGVISDAPVNEAARFNLMQVAQLLQQLAMANPSDGDPQRKCVLSKVDKSNVTAFLDIVIGGGVSESPPTSSTDLLEGLTRTAVYMTQSQLYALVDFVRGVAAVGNLCEEDQLTLESLLSEVPQSPIGSCGSLERTPPSLVSPNRKSKVSLEHLCLLNKSSSPIPPATPLSRSALALDGELDTNLQEVTQEGMPEEVLVISLGVTSQTIPGMMSETEVLALQVGNGAEDASVLDNLELCSKAEKEQRFSPDDAPSEGMRNRSSSDSSLDLEVESVSEREERMPESSAGAEALRVLQYEHAATGAILEDRLHKFVLADNRDPSETVSETWSMDPLVSNFEFSVDKDRLEDVAGSSSSSLMDPFTGTIFSETASDAWSVEVLASDSDTADLKQDERLQEVESCSGVGSVSDDAEVREVNSRSSTPELSVVSGNSATSEDTSKKAEHLRVECSSECGSKTLMAEPLPEELDQSEPTTTCPPSQTDSLLEFNPPSSVEGSYCQDVIYRTKELHPRMRKGAWITHQYVYGDQAKQRHSLPDRFSQIRDADSDALGASRRPFSDPGLCRQVALQGHDLSGRLPTGPLSSATGDSLKGLGEKKENDEEKLDRSRPWWKKRLASAIPKGEPHMAPFRKKDKQEKESAGQAQVQPGVPQRGDCVAKSSSGEMSQKIAVDDAPQSVPETPRPQPIRFPFSDAKKKLRLALSLADFVIVPIMPSDSTCNGLFDPTEPEDSELVCFLKVQLAEAINLQNKNLMAQIQETLRCVNRFDEDTCRKLLAELAQDYRKRAPYVAYLTRCRQGLQTSQAYLERLLQRVLRDKEVVNRCFTGVCVRLLLRRMEVKMLEFTRAFQAFTAADEKTAAMEEFLRQLYGAMAHDPIWQFASEEQLQDAQMAIERTVMNRIFKLAFYPNQDGDILRDQLLQEHIERLSRVVTANHRSLQIPEVYLKEAPWPSAQAEIRTMSMYKTPRGKVQCVLRMCSCIMNLLSLANEASVPGADDFLPVLVFVLIKANPPCLLSTIQYINNFYGSRLSGEESYWWMQFTAAVEFIKTIDDRE